MCGLPLGFTICVFSCVRRRRNEKCVCVCTMHTTVSAHMKVCKESQLGDKREESTNDRRRKSERETPWRKKAPTMLLSFGFPPLTSLRSAPTQQECRLRRCLCPIDVLRVTADWFHWWNATKYMHLIFCQLFPLQALILI